MSFQSILGGGSEDSEKKEKAQEANQDAEKLQEKSDQVVEDLQNDLNIEIEWFHNKLVEWGMPDEMASYINTLGLLTVTILIAYIAGRIARRVLISLFSKFTAKTATRFDDYLLENHAFKNVAGLVPYSIITIAAPIVFSDIPQYMPTVKTILEIYFIVIIVKIVRSILYSVRDYLETTENFKDKPVQSYIQVVLIFMYMVAFLVGFSIITGKSVIAFLTALGAASAVLILVFKDTILGFVASIQVATNDIVRIGDWIEMPKYGADGDVVEINLATVKVQNWDKTITTIPTYALISDSFKNWRGMQDAGGRRIKRAIHIKISSIRHVSEEDMERLMQVQLIEEQLKEKEQEIKQYNKEKGINKDVLINGRHLTNLGVFRMYAEAYVKNHPDMNHDMTMMVRHLEPTIHGLPVEIYAFASKTEWKVYECIMADVFDHLLASVRYFALEVFEEPAADDLRSLQPIQKENENILEEQPDKEEKKDNEKPTEQEIESNDDNEKEE